MKKLCVVFAIFTTRPSIIHAQVNFGDKKDGGIVYYTDGTGRHGLIEYPKDLGAMDWSHAKTCCAKLGKGWRLPSKDELNKLYRVKSAIGGFSNLYYWSSSDYGGGAMWAIDFASGLQGNGYKYYFLNVRAVRAF